MSGAPERGATTLPVALEHTLDFIAGALPPPPVHVLEVGAGDGALAAQLSRRGYAVTTIDRSAEACATARARGGFAVIEGEFLEYGGEPPKAAGGRGADGPPAEPDPFDAVLFTRSLHHVHPLAAAADRAVAMIHERSLVVVEDFAYERADRATLAWAAATEARLRRDGQIDTDEAPLFGPDPAASWIAHHREKHSVSEGGAMTAALTARLHVERLESAPYLYRYFSGRLRGPGAAETGRALFAEEERLIADRSLAAIGLRIVARRQE